MHMAMKSRNRSTFSRIRKKRFLPSLSRPARSSSRVMANIMQITKRAMMLTFTRALIMAGLWSQGRPQRCSGPALMPKI